MRPPGLEHPPSACQLGLPTQADGGARLLRDAGLSGSQDDSVRNSHSSRRPDGGAATTTGFAGGTFKSTNEFLPGGTEWGRAGVQTAYGSQTMRDGAHNSDQWEIYSSNTYRTALLERADVEANAERRITLEFSWPGSSR
eukprot:SAG11_NODE_935_length_6482_cov_25.242676_1_plen_140_part_00